MLLFTQLVLAITFLAHFLLLLLMMRQHKKNANDAFMFFALFVLCITVWTGGIFINLWMESILIEMIIFAAVIAGLVLQLIFIYRFLQFTRNSIFEYTAIAIGFFFFVMSFWHGAMFRDFSLTENGYTELTNGWLSSSLVFFVLTYTLLPIALLIYKRRTTQKYTQLCKQINCLLYGFLIFFLINIFSNAILPIFFHVYIFNAIGPVFSLGFLTFIAYIITRYHFLNLRLVIQRSLVYIILFSIILLLYIVILFTLEHFFHNATRLTSVVSAGATMFIGIFTTPFLERFFQKMTRHIFFKDDYDSIAVLRAIHKTMSTHRSPHDLCHHVMIRLTQIFHTHTCTILSFQHKKLFLHGGAQYSTRTFPQHILQTLSHMTTSLFEDLSTLPPTTHAWLIKKHYVAIVPIIFDTNPIGILFLGHKGSEEHYNAKDRIFLSQVASQLAVILEKFSLQEQQKSYATNVTKQVSQQTQKIADAQKSQEQMMLNISHALKTPLTILGTEIDTLDKEVPHMQLHPLRHALNEVSKSVTSLLKLARMENRATSDNQYDIIDISALAELLCEYFKRHAQTQGITISHMIEDHCFINGARNDIEELFVNIVENAIKYMPQHNAIKKIHIDIAQKNESIVLTISDNGFGIPQKDLPHLFDRFYRVKTSATKDVSGSGLGLAICKTIVMQHGGTIRVESTLHEGTTFIMTFPRVEKNA